METETKVRVCLSVESGIRKASGKKSRKEYGRKITIGTDSKLHSLGELSYHECSLTTEELAEKLLDGHAVMHLFGQTGVFKTFLGMKDQWQGAQLVCVDCDGSPLNFKKTFQILEEQKQAPTFGHTTFSNGKPGRDFCFRLYYVLSECITDLNRYHDICYQVMDIVEEAINSHYPLANRWYADPASARESQLFFGNPNSNTVEEKHTGNVYITGTFPMLTDEQRLREKTKREKKTPNAAKQYAQREKHSKSRKQRELTYSTRSCAQEVVRLFRQTFADDDEILSRFASQYPPLYHTPLPEVAAEQPFIEVPDDFIQLKPRFYNESGQGKSQIKHYCNGEHRHDHLYHLLIVTRYMTGDQTTFDELLMQGLQLFHLWFSNKEKNGSDCTPEECIDHKFIYSLTLDVWSDDIGDYWEKLTDSFQEHSPKHFVVNPATIAARKLSSKELEAEAREAWTRHYWEPTAKQALTLREEGKTWKDVLTLLNGQSHRGVTRSSLFRHIQLYQQNHQPATSQKQAERGEKSREKRQNGVRKWGHTL